MFINFFFNGKEHVKILEQALRSFDEDGKSFKLSAMSGQIWKVSISLKFFSPFLSEIIESITLVNEEQTIILPDCSSSSIKHLINLLTEGCTQTYAAPLDVAAIIEVANMLRIDLKNLVFDEITNQSDLTKVDDELDDGEIRDDEAEEDNVPKVHKKGQGYLATVPVESKIKIAAFAKADMSIQNLVHFKNNNNASFKCQECQKSFAEEEGLIKKMSIMQERMEYNFEKCVECNKVFMRKLELLNRIEIHTSSRENTLATLAAKDREGEGCVIPDDNIVDGCHPGQWCSLPCSSIRIGNYKVFPKEKITITDKGVQLKVPAIINTTELVTINIPMFDVFKVLAHFGKSMPLLFLYILPSACVKARRMLKMTNSQSFYLDVQSNDETQKRITILPEKLTEDNKTILKQHFGRNLQLLEKEDADKILVRSSHRNPTMLKRKMSGVAVLNSRNRFFSQSTGAACGEVLM